MLSLNEVIKKSKEEALINGIIDYNDNIPYSTEGITDSNGKYCLLKAIEGLAIDDNTNCNTEIFILLKKYVFNNLDAEKLQIDDGDVKGLIELRLIVSPESSYIERLDKLMLRIYFEKGRCELEGLIYEIYDKYEWAKSFFVKYKDDEKYMIFQENTEVYKKKFGICEEKDNKVPHNKMSQDKIEKDWILQKFGG